MMRGPTQTLSNTFHWISIGTWSGMARSTRVPADQPATWPQYQTAAGREIAAIGRTAKVRIVSRMIAALRVWIKE